MASADEFTRAVRRFLSGIAESAGASAPESLGNQATPITDTSKGEVARSTRAGHSTTYADRDDTGPAYRGTPNDMAWRDQNRSTMGGYRETTVFAPADDKSTASVDPNRAAMWWIDCAGDVTVQLLDTEAVVGLDPYVPVPKQSELVTIWFTRAKGKTITWPSDWKWSVDVRGSAIGADNPFAASTQDAQVDVFTVMRIPDKGVFAFLAGRKMS